MQVFSGSSSNGLPVTYIGQWQHSPHWIAKVLPTALGPLHATVFLPNANKTWMALASNREQQLCQYTMTNSEQGWCQGFPPVNVDQSWAYKINDIAYGSDSGRWVAVAERTKGNSTQGVILSGTGVDYRIKMWVQPEEGDTVYPARVVYGNKKFLVIGESKNPLRKHAKGFLAISEDGENWSTETEAMPWLTDLIWVD